MITLGTLSISVSLIILVVAFIGFTLYCQRNGFSDATAIVLAVPLSLYFAPVIAHQALVASVFASMPSYVPILIMAALFFTLIKLIISDDYAMSTAIIPAGLVSLSAILMIIASSTAVPEFNRLLISGHIPYIEVILNSAAWSAVGSLVLLALAWRSKKRF